MIKKYLDSVLAGLQDAVPRRAVRWVRAENVHLTLRFIGDVSTADLHALEAGLTQAVVGMPPFTLHLAAPGCFPNPHAPRVLWIGLAGELDALAALHQAVARATQAWGEPEGRDFHPHLTLGRVNAKRHSELRAIGEAMDALSVPVSEPWRVNELHLMRSDLQPAGAVYTSLAQFSFA
jgi:2'-5' RNA ligase